MKDVRGVAGTRSHGRKGGQNDGWTDGRTHTRTDEAHFYSPPPPASSDKKQNLTHASFIRSTYLCCRAVKIVSVCRFFVVECGYILLLTRGKALSE